MWPLRSCQWFNGEAEKILSLYKSFKWPLPNVWRKKKNLCKSKNQPVLVRIMEWVEICVACTSSRVGFSFPPYLLSAFRTELPLTMSLPISPSHSYSHLFISRVSYLLKASIAVLSRFAVNLFFRPVFATEERRTHTLFWENVALKE